MPTQDLPQPEFGSDVVAHLMRAFGIKYAAMNPGATFRGIHDSLVNYGGNRDPELILCCHEEIAVRVAHGYAKASGKPMAAIVHNIAGLQLADLVAHPAFRFARAQRDGQELPDDFGARIAAVLRDKKFRRSSSGKIDGWGIKWLP